MQPRILLSASKTPPTAYIDAVTQCGGIPVAAYLPEIDLSCDGLILCGGGDVHPKYFGEDIDGSKEIDPDRDEAEFALIRTFLEAGKPILGICRGHQLLNIYFGGSLHQDLSCAAAHSSGSDYDLVHTVTAAEGSLLGGMYGSRFTVNSYHHQGIKAVGQGLKVTLTSEEGVIEGIEHESLPVFGVQWHPERMSFSHRREDTVDGAKIFQHFLKLCGK